LDLDRFKIVNDTCGHFAGDQLLKQLSQVMKEKIRKSDVCARLGGDEFGIILLNCPFEKAEEVALSICQAVQQHHFSWMERTYTVGVSIGLVPIQSSSAQINTLINIADEACYIAKEKGGNTIHSSSSSELDFSSLNTERRLALLLNNAFQKNEFFLHAQSIVPLQAPEKEKRYEILLRIFDEERNILTPSVFLSAATRYKMMPSIDRSIIRSYFAYHYEHYHAKKEKAHCNINLSGASLNDHFFQDFLISLAKEFEIDPEYICFEITETIAIDNFNLTIEFLKKMKTLGFKFALDDFGSGMSSFSYLRLLPVDYVKIDGSFIKNIAADTIDHSIVESIHNVAHLMHIATIAECVETEGVFQKLKTIGIDYAQGFFIEKPSRLG
jgi:diguanylate cyclase (GGDEF)-like protein